MDIFEMCTDNTEIVKSSASTKLEPLAEPSSERRLPRITELPLENNENRESSGVLADHNPLQQYQLEYILQHRYLKSYNDSPHFSSIQPISPASQHLPIQLIEPQEVNQITVSPNEATYQIQNKNNQDLHDTNMDEIMDESSTSPNIFQASKLSEDLRDSQNSESTILVESKAIKSVLDQCFSIYQKVGKFRDDPLRESERNQIIEDIFSTAENMLKSLKDIENSGNSSDSNMDCSKSVDQDLFTTDNEATSEENQIIRQARNLQKLSQAKYRRRSRNSMIGHKCHSCKTTETPEWRRGPDGARTLCNACGLHYAKLIKKGSLTVQTHNYTIGNKPNINTTPKVIEFPIIQVINNIDNHDPFNSKSTSQNSRTKEIRSNTDTLSSLEKNAKGNNKIS